MYLFTAVIISSSEYRLNDIVKNYPGARDYACTNPSSLACQYLTQTSASNDYVQLARLVHAKIVEEPWLGLDPSVIAIHVRAGDGIIGPDCFTNQSQCLHTNCCVYGRDRAYFDELDLPNGTYVLYSNTKHGNRKEGMQRKYLTDVTQYLSQFGPIIHKVNTPIDETFTEMATACSLYITGGGFGKLARKVHRVLSVSESYRNKCT